MYSEEPVLPYRGDKVSAVDQLQSQSHLFPKKKKNSNSIELYIVYSIDLLIRYVGVGVGATGGKERTGSGCVEPETEFLITDNSKLAIHLE